ncbi:armadillo-type protein [Favolaschia claudopus]|uniref:Armadillo-type protein n=1 Tax=Favolaschia claudopus TaxID=2862362 RepID=A0AAV9ZE99_9AGAR
MLPNLQPHSGPFVIWVPAWTQATYYQHNLDTTQPVTHPPHMLDSVPETRGWLRHQAAATSADLLEQHRPTTSSLRSDTLSSFLMTRKMQNWKLKASLTGLLDIAGHITEFSGDRIGSRFIQTQMETASLEELKGVFHEIVPYSTLQLIQDIYGNHVIQKLFEYGTQNQTDAMLGMMEKHVFQLACHSYASFVVRKAVACGSPAQQSRIITHLKPHIMACRHLDWHRIPSDPEFLQCCFENLPNRQRSPLIEEVLNRGHLRELFLTQFGSYTIQWILEEGYPEEKGRVVAELRGRFLDMAKHKFASHICEKALLYYNSDASRALIDEILDSNSIRCMMRDQYASELCAADCIKN